MKAKLASFLIVIVLCLSSCAASPAKDQANAYFTIFEALYETDSAMNEDSIYLALDLTNVYLADAKPLIALTQSFCDENGYTLLLDTADSLTEKGYIKDFFFEEGFLIVFEDIQLSEQALVTKATKWRSGKGAVGAHFTAKKSGETWQITKTSNAWIS